MRTLITAEQVFSLAFTSEESYNVSVITASDIGEVENRYLIPIIGENFYNAMRLGEYDDLVEERVAPMVAAWVRYTIEPLLASRSCLYHDERMVTEAVNDDVLMRLRALRDKAVVLTRRLVNYLNANSVAFDEYDPDSNPLNRCFIYGNIIQVY